MEWCSNKKVISVMLTVGFIVYITLSHVTLDEDGHPIVRFFKAKRVRIINYITWFTLFLLLNQKERRDYPLDRRFLVEKKTLNIEG